MVECEHQKERLRVASEDKSKLYWAFYCPTCRTSVNKWKGEKFMQKVGSSFDMSLLSNGGRFEIVLVCRGFYKVGYTDWIPPEKVDMVKGYLADKGFNHLSVSVTEQGGVLNG